MQGKWAGLESWDTWLINHGNDYLWSSWLMASSFMFFLGTGIVFTWQTNTCSAFPIDYHVMMWKLSVLLKYCNKWHLLQWWVRFQPMKGGKFLIQNLATSSMALELTCNRQLDDRGTCRASLWPTWDSFVAN